MKIIIVDDELIERKAMKKFITESLTHMEVVSEAANGRIAIEQARLHKPDIMFMDIHMPGIDGLEAIRQILAELPQTKFIMVSAYNSFEYAKEAMKQGVKEYILKPSNKQETLESLLRVEKEIKEARQIEEQTKQQLNETEKLVKQQLITAITQNEITADTEQMYRSLYPNAQMGFFQVITGCDITTLSNTLKHKTDLPHIIKAQGDKQTVLFLSEKKSAHHLKADALNLARALSHELPSDTNIGIGSPFAELDKLSISYQQALLASTQLTKETSVSYGFPLLNEKEDSTAKKLEKSIQNEITAGRVDQATDYFHLYYDHLTKQFDQNEKVTQHIREWAIKIKQAIEEEGINLRDLPILQANTKDDFIHLLRQFGEKIILQGEGNDAISKAKTYIHDHYKESFSLEDVAAYVELTPTYFTKMFKEQTKTTFIDYVTDYRIEKSQELLLQTNLSLKEIAYEVGYKDPNYYSRVFKKVTNLSPKQFRSTTK
ncbi:response regulator [Metabacillus litoralis]|uniref:response regulator n=1 Tax=Metabacillus TaxID=2675233 RepID=UPI001BA019B4|nr:response regulator [Metabacillus litoralis]UHA61364.1 response regulator [Metabacillus litoralis]